MGIYIDELVVKRKLEAGHLQDLQTTFDILKAYKLKLNATKCAFGVGFDKFLGYLVMRRGIKADPQQVKVIPNLQPPWKLKEV